MQTRESTREKERDRKREKERDGGKKVTHLAGEEILFALACGVHACEIDCKRIDS
jgi:hypothetical protein